MLEQFDALEFITLMFTKNETRNRVKVEMFTLEMDPVRKLHIRKNLDQSTHHNFSIQDVHEKNCFIPSNVSLAYIAE